MRITGVISGAVASVIVAYTSAAAPAPDEAARTAFVDEFLKVKRWNVCGVQVGSDEHLTTAETFKFERVGSTNTIKIVPLTGTWGLGWWDLGLELKGDPKERFKLNPRSWPQKCKGSGQNVPGEKDSVGDETNTVRFVGDACLPSLDPDGTCKAGRMHRVFVFFRPDTNGGSSGNHLYIEHCAPEEESQGRCEPPHPTAKATSTATRAVLTPHPGHIHSDP